MSTLVESVTAAIKAATWLEPTDQAAVDLALTYAREIDHAVENLEGQERTKTLYLGPHLLNTLRALGCAPEERKALKEGESVGGKLAQLRGLKGGKAS